jgi:Ca2+-binding EF-hand superfamily protein
MPAVEAAHEEKRKVVTGVYEKHVPWHIAPSYHETDPFKSLVLQKQQKETYKLPPVKKTVNKATAKDGGDKESHLGDDDSSDGDGPMDKATLALLRERFNIFDNLNTGWIDSKDVPVVFGQFYYYAQRPEELGRAALLKYDPDYYTALEWPEFVEVAGHFLTLEKEGLVSLAQSAGTDGALGLDAVRSLAKSLGEDFFPWAISEVLGGDDQTVDEEGFVDAVRKLRKTAGFTSEERDELMGAWGKFCPAEVDPSPQAGSKLYLPLPKFKNLLQYQSYNVDVFDDFLIKIGQRDKPIRHDDFLWAVRMFRNELTSSYEKVFHASDFDRSGEIEINELYDCLKRLGFYCNAKAVQEAMDIVDRDKTGGMSFDEFILLMQHLRKSEGFTKAEIDEFESLHAKFDTDNDGEISTLELGFLLRYLGMPTNLDMLQKNLYEVDVDGSGSMDMGELLKLMRKFRNDEEYTTEATFSALAEADCDDQGNPLHDPPQYYIPVEALPDIIAAMGYEPTPHMVGLARKLPPWCFFPQTNLAGFKTFTVAYRDLERSEFHVRAGFTEEQVEEYRTSFQAYDRSGDGEMSVNEIMPLLKDLGRAPQTPKQRDRLAQMLDEIDEDKTGEISFDEFLQLMRKFCDEQDVEKLAKEERLKQKAKFKDDEVEQWRAIFIKFDSGGEQEMGLPDVKTVLGAVGVNTNVREPAEDLKKKFYAADQDGSETLDFPEFLLLMRALLDADFGGIATRKDLVKKKK